MEIELLELFSGIGGFAKGIIDSGVKVRAHYFSEINKHAIANYRYNFKGAEYVGSVVDFSGKGFTPTIITFGSPCQDFSLAGKKLGMGGERSVLILQAIRIIRECRPSVFIWENVKGAFTSNDGADFWAILSAFANIGGYRLEWQLLNTNWFLPQNRERIYLVGHLAGKSEPGVFPFKEDDFMVDQTYREEKKRGSRIQVQSNRNASALNQRMAKMSVDDNYIKVTSNTKAGYELATVGDGVRFDHLVENSTGRGRVTKQQSHTIDTGGKLGVVTKIGTWRTHEDGKGFREMNNGESPTIPSRGRTDGSGQPVIQIETEDDVRIRQLTEIECERLQGFPDDWTKCGDYGGDIKEISRTQRYKLLGNAVTVDVVKAIASRLKINV